jgi:hypothetical protein
MLIAAKHAIIGADESLALWYMKLAICANHHFFRFTGACLFGGFTKVKRPVASLENQVSNQDNKQQEDSFQRVSCICTP